MGVAPSAIRRMAARDYELLQRYAIEEPFGPWRDNANIAIMASALYNRTLRKGERPTKPQDFMLAQRKDYDRDRRAEYLEFFRSKAVKNGGSGKARRST